jgi:ketosteroid isomerase-like protein
MPGSADLARRTRVLEELYDAFDARDVAAALAHLAPGVDWTDVATGARVHGRDAVRDAWLAEWRDSDPVVKPLRIEPASDGTIHVRVDQLIRDRAGKILENRQVGHVYTFDGAFITKMRIVEVAPEQEDEE